MTIGCVTGERLHHCLSDAACGLAVTRVEGRLSTADLSFREHDIVARLAQKLPCVRQDTGKDQIAKAGSKELNALHDAAPA